MKTGLVVGLISNWLLCVFQCLNLICSYFPECINGSDEKMAGVMMSRKTDEQHIMILLNVQHMLKKTGKCCCIIQLVIGRTILLISAENNTCHVRFIMVCWTAE